MAWVAFRSPLRKLVTFFKASRDKWKAKCQRARYDLKLLKRRFANLQLSRDQSQHDYQQAEAQRVQLQARGEHLQAQQQQLQAQVEALLKKGSSSSASFASAASGQ
jgi:FtsZ-binding cell division protein ZapB